MPNKLTYVIAVGVILASSCTRAPSERMDVTGIRLLSQSPDAQSFDRADAVRAFEFPRDHGVHERFATEWWYFTGNVHSDTNRHFGFELTFFRYALSGSRIERESRWASNQVWLAHFTLTDTRANRFLMAERMGRGALGIAGAAADHLDVFVRDWSAYSSTDGEVIRLEAKSADASISLELADAAPIALHGDRGLDRKGPEPGNASYYYSIPRMIVTGTVQPAPGEPVAVTGTAWLDREWATSSLDEGVEGWDWFGLQLEDGRNLMLYRLRNADGSLNEFSTGTLIFSDGSTDTLGPDDVHYEILSHWTSPASRVTYPLEWRVGVPELGMEMHVSPRVENQEFNLGLRYWEGAVEVTGSDGTGALAGSGYLELAGYR